MTEAWKNMDKKERNMIIRSVLYPLFTLIICLAGLMYFFNGSFGWFTDNRAVSATGLDVTAITHESLIVGDSPADVTNISGDDGVFFFHQNRVTAQGLFPATWNSSAQTLQYVTNPEVVNAFTGKVKPGATLTYDTAQPNVHYLEYTTYVGTRSQDYPYTSFSIRLDPDTTYLRCYPTAKAQNGITYYSREGDTYTPVSGLIAGTSDVSDYYTHEPTGDLHHAISIAVYWGDATPENFRGVLNTHGNTSVTLTNTNGTLTPTEPVKITMRCYFDGALTSPSGVHYVRTADLNASGVDIGVAIDAPAASKG